MATKKVITSKVPTFKVGEWVQLIKGAHNNKKGSLGVISSKPQEEKSYDSYTHDYTVPSGIFMIAVVIGEYSYMYNTKNLKKVATPSYVVAWTNEDEDPVEHFLTLKEAQAFKTKIAGKRYKGEKIIEANIYKLV